VSSSFGEKQAERHRIRSREKPKRLRNVNHSKSFSISTDFFHLDSLQEQKEKQWGDLVQLIYGDMRRIEVPEKIDILVSELLGSFGDNEASPECLDGAMRFLKREWLHAKAYVLVFTDIVSSLADGISIPASYTAYLAPISSSKLHTEVLANTTKASPETPYVVMFQAVNILSGEGGGLRSACGTKVQECWSFAHPRRDAVLDSHGTKTRYLKESAWF
jgi:protein arginine N-methyltransferase 5